ncbi:MAG TPA: glycosyltransferase family 1 protein [Prolixibacteraceae bacterium]|nr:glycosyltransferase family 1 protein [Prolixibacteraceae bacterium]
MRIAVNTQHLLKGKLEGIGWFAHETLSRITRAHPEHEFLFIFDRPWDSSFLYSDNIIPVHTKIPSRHPFLWYWHYEKDVPKLLSIYQPDLFFSPDGWMSLATNVPTVDVVHDLNFMHRPGDFPFLYRKYYQHFFPQYIRKARRIVTVSDFSKADIMHTFGVSPGKIDIAYNGCNPLFQPVSTEVKEKVREKFSGANPYFVYVGSQHPRKNILGMLEAFERFKAGDKRNFRFLLVGEPMWSDRDIRQLLDRMKYRADVVFTGRLSTEALHMVMASAEALVLVSFLEGFGIPVLEAMHCDVPVICSGITSLPEIAGEAALRVNPKNTDEIARAYTTLAEQASVSLRLIEKGRQQRQKFNWDLTAQAVWCSLEKAMTE